MSVKNDNFKSDGKVAFLKERNLSLTWRFVCSNIQLQKWYKLLNDDRNWNLEYVTNMSIKESADKLTEKGAISTLELFCTWRGKREILRAHFQIRKHWGREWKGTKLRLWKLLSSAKILLKSDFIFFSLRKWNSGGKCETRPRKRKCVEAAKIGPDLRLFLARDFLFHVQSSEIYSDVYEGYFVRICVTFLLWFMLEQ